MIASSAAGLCHIYFDRQHNYSACYIFKPLTIVLLLLALVIQTAQSEAYLYFTAGLTCCLLGDIFLMLRQKQFTAGLSSFLLGHICYSIGFQQKLIAPVEFSSLIVIAIFTLSYYAYLYRHLAKLKLAVLLYVIAMSALIFTSYNLWLQLQQPLFLVALIGSVLFSLSDSVLAYNRFIKPFSAAQPLILGSYYIAQWMILAPLIFIH